MHDKICFGNWARPSERMGKDYFAVWIHQLEAHNNNNNNTERLYQLSPVCNKRILPKIHIIMSISIFSVALYRDFAYVARDPSTGKHKCHMFRCHGNISGRAITNALHDMCSKILEEKKKAQESGRKMSTQKPWSDIINTPPPSSARGTIVG